MLFSLIFGGGGSGAIDISDAGRLAYVLTGIGKLIEAELIETRLAQLERKLLKRTPG